MTLKPSPAIRGACVAGVIALAVAACGGDDASEVGSTGTTTTTATAASTSAPSTTTGTSTTTASSTPATTSAPATTTPSPSTTMQPTTSAPVTTTTSTTTTVPCTEACPPDAATLQRIEEFIDAYNAGDWEAWTTLIADDEPTWNTPLGLQSTALLRFDFEWSDSLDEVWTLGDCVERTDDISCAVAIEDEFHRQLAFRGVVPSECRISVAVDDDGVVSPVSYDIVPCHDGYDSEFHAFGHWFEEEYPEEETIQGFHYRAWNQPSPDRAERAMEVLPDYVAELSAGG